MQKLMNAFGGGSGMPDMSGMDPKELAKLAKQSSRLFLNSKRLPFGYKGKPVLNLNFKFKLNQNGQGSSPYPKQL